ncbi:unnamed protein product [Zymoseptoria tritici ST99CH_1A5]|uniref:Uncharacterized protein n=4 Tax=Zymoseptoria tritici TaxID=1047171 RepID=F9X4P8_ZYMTI|nr:uncharacterized protein MYCGRDRAFT_99255 [Zymoseptoria tritici IPO323]SMQ47986.1 unnamed protein product [Zymoseptoria tritici ST99CH_3D7]SMR46531.1 unnamed protein product [Zymoseptoria tritici ST99CH_1E4]SMR47774.1 unnamed protein product [Zymoseptoria tritici ST99CH_3D1]SMY21677.1 unnamed protein product [Zymoseptoria tritici ST99CH_1A5]EGP90082.1 hypothetical protein MYCGRDRAFT_99255 [Zymoseptoria tritici IPO323]
MPQIPRSARTEGSSTFDPDRFFEAWAKGEITAPSDNDFKKSILTAFGLPSRDNYVYKAVAAVSLEQAQAHVAAGGNNGLHGWYKTSEGQPRPPPSSADIAAYVDIFRPTTNTSKALKALGSNAKKGTVREDVAKHLLALYAPPDDSRKLVVNKSKTHANPYFDVWAWACQNLEWAGPEESTAEVKISHAILPVLYHHFGCVVPSYESLAFIQQVVRGRTILDVGSGNGYWCYALRNFDSNPKKKMTVTPIDNGLSEWRTLWVADTIEVDGAKWLQQNNGGLDDVLLLVYPMVGNDFTSKMLKAYRGTTIISAGAQNSSGFTAFKSETIADWMGREMPSWEKVLQVPLPSFAGKDEALFIFEKKQ